jgi:glycosyltransferase involved in cell wall biosynthesis
MSKPLDGDPKDKSRSLRIAVHGVLAEGAGSGAGTFPVLLEALLTRGHHVEVFGIRGFNEPKSLERFERYRFVPLQLPRLERLWWQAYALKSPYPLSLVSQLAQIGWHREAAIHIDALRDRFDLILCTDAVALWPASLPIISWPQSPPQTEAQALRSPETRRRVIENTGALRYGAVQLFYAYRWALVRASLDISDAYLCGSNWARDEWERFGARWERLFRMAYLVDLSAFAEVPVLGAIARPPTFLWLGRATPRKRLDLFLQGFRALRTRHPAARARVVGNLQNDAYAARVLESHGGDPGLSVEAALPRAEVPRLFGQIDVLVQPSENENFGFSVAEALAAGRPVVLGPTNGTADYVGGAGFTFSAYRPDAVAAAMERAMLAAARDGAALSTAARQAAREHFTPAIVVQRFEDTCREVLARGARARGRRSWRFSMLNSVAKVMTQDGERCG